MARPKKDQSNDDYSPTVRETAPETLTPAVPTWTPPPQPREMRMHRQGAKSEPYVRHFPQVRSGICEFCGVLDPNLPSHDQYKLCQHYRGKQLWCSYCPPDKNPDETNTHSVLNNVEHPYIPNTLITVCDSTECQRKFREEFQH